MGIADRAIVTLEGLQSLFEVLRQRGCRVIGPTRRDAAIVYEDISNIADLPKGWTDEQDGGHYRLKKRDDEALFFKAFSPGQLLRIAVKDGLAPLFSQLRDFENSDDRCVSYPRVKTYDDASAVLVTLTP